jgi:hypothetical protein
MQLRSEMGGATQATISDRLGRSTGHATQAAFGLGPLVLGRIRLPVERDRLPGRIPQMAATVPVQLFAQQSVNRRRRGGPKLLAFYPVHDILKRFRGEPVGSNWFSWFGPGKN